MTDSRTMSLLRLEQARRRQVDGLYHWQPYNRQQAFIDSVLRQKAQENWFVAANRSGKTDAGAYCGAILARFGSQVENTDFSSSVGPRTIRRSKPTTGWVIALDFPTSRDVIQPKYFDNGQIDPSASHPPFIPNHEIESWSVSNQILKLKNGSIIGFKSADSKRKKFQGAGRAWIHIDEEVEKGIYEEVAIRVGQVPLNIFGTATMLPPEGEQGGISWLFPEKIQPFLKDRANALAHIFGASIYDNPHIPSQEVARMEAIYPEGSTERRIRLEGEWLPGIGGAMAYPVFDHELNIAPQLEYYNAYKPLVWAWDFNVDPMVCLIGQSDGSQFRVFEEMVKSDGDIAAICDRFYHRWGVNHKSEFHIYGDATGRGRSGQTGKSSYYMILASSMPIRNRLKLKVPESNPHVVDRINSVNYCCRNEKGERNLLVDPRCEELIRDFSEVLRDPSGGIKKSTRRRDPYAKRTHYTDALGYWISFEAPVVANPVQGRASMPNLSNYQPIRDVAYHR